MKTNNARLFLDDCRPMPIGWHTVRSFTEFTEYIEDRGVPETISFDHDLGIEDQNDGDKRPEDYKEKTGLDCAQWLIERGGSFPKLAIVHSFNPVGARNIAEALAPYCPVLIRPWTRANYESLQR